MNAKPPSEPSTYAPGGDVTTQATGVDLIAAERQRQVDEEGRTPEHDREHTDGALAWAAVCLAAPEPVYLVEQGRERTTWREPWPRDWFRKPSGTYDNGFQRTEPEKLRDLVKAGALIAAEIDRLTAKHSDDPAHYTQVENA